MAHHTLRQTDPNRYGLFIPIQLNTTLHYRTVGKGIGVGRSYRRGTTCFVGVRFRTGIGSFETAFDQIPTVIATLASAWTAHVLDSTLTDKAIATPVRVPTYFSEQVQINHVQ